MLQNLVLKAVIPFQQQGHILPREGELACSALFIVSRLMVDDLSVVTVGCRSNPANVPGWSNLASHLYTQRYSLS